MCLDDIDYELFRDEVIYDVKEEIARLIEKHAEEYGDPADNAYEYARLVRNYVWE